MSDTKPGLPDPLTAPAVCEFKGRTWVPTQNYREAVDALIAEKARADAAEKQRETIEALRDERIVELERREAVFREYVDLLTEELGETAVLAALRGWKSTRCEEGERLREALRPKEVMDQ